MILSKYMVWVPVIGQFGPSIISMPNMVFMEKSGSAPLAMFSKYETSTLTFRKFVVTPTIKGAEYLPTVAIETRRIRTNCVSFFTPFIQNSSRSADDASIPIQEVSRN